jgi:hypothetical protein
MERALWIVTMVGVALGSLIFWHALTENSPPRQAALAGLALCCGVLPYVLARAVRGYKTADGAAARQPSSEFESLRQPSDPATEALIQRLTRQGAVEEDSATDPGV